MARSTDRGSVWNDSEYAQLVSAFPALYARNLPEI